MENFTCPHCQNIFQAEKRPNAVLLCPHCNGVVLIPEDELKPGTLVGGFEIVRLLGRGGMGNVYLASQMSMQRLVALKLLSSGLVDDPNILSQFKSEVQLSGKLQHPNIITAIDAGEENNTLFLAVNYIDGEDYEKRMNRDFAIPEKEALELALKISDALKYAWEKHGLLHKDIKPGNIIRDRRGEVFLMDLGIAQKITSKTENDEFVLGSPFYMSPEQAKGEALDWRSDQYSLGATLFHMIVGVPPFDAGSPNEIILKQITEPFPDPKKCNPNAKVSNGVLAVLKKMMAKKPDDRFSSWDDFKLIVGRLLSGEAEKSTKTSAVNLASRAGKKPAAAPRAPVNLDRLPRQDISKIAASLPRPQAAAGKTLAIRYGIIGVSILLCILLIRSCSVNYDAKLSIQAADDYMRRYPYEYEEIIARAKFARETCKGTFYARQAEEFYKKAFVFAEDMKREQETYQDNLDRAEKLYGKRKFGESERLLRDMRAKTRDPDRLARIDAMLGQIELTRKTLGKGIDE